MEGEDILMVVEADAVGAAAGGEDTMHNPFI
jgi:hypothetical protein